MDTWIAHNPPIHISSSVSHLPSPASMAPSQYWPTLTFLRLPDPLLFRVQKEGAMAGNTNGNRNGLGAHTGADGALNGLREDGPQAVSLLRQELDLERSRTQ